MFTSILCPVDFSEQSERALEHGVELAEALHAHVTILTVLDPLLDAASHDVLTAQTQQELRALLKRVSPRMGARSEPPGVIVKVGNPAEEILTTAKECEADLIVMGTHGLGAAQRLVFGSTTERVLRETRLPVLVEPAEHEAHER